MVGHAWKAHRTEEDRVMVAEPRDAVSGHHAPSRFVSLATPVEMAKAEADAEFRAGRLENLEALGHHLFADAIARDDGYFVGLHRASALRSSRIIEE